MNKDSQQLKELSRKLISMDIGEIRMKTEAGRERYLEALERLLCVIEYLQKDF